MSSEVCDADDTMDHEMKRNKDVKVKMYKFVIIKRARVKNDHYMNWKGKTVQPKPHGHHCKCKLKCTWNISEGDVMEVYFIPVDFGTENEKDSYLQSLMEIKYITQRHKILENSSEDRKPKNRSFKYYISSSAGKLSVCKTAFLNIHNISSDKVRRLGILLSEGKSSKDFRGKARPRNTIPGSHVAGIQQHISSFPIHESRYT
ncbi:hypothetical protein ANN_22674 [Periplaneta americana]|uniref:Uncharacterized protein n=1 Tax=Periplaneta americana TaxID=6978 RepID=A0ABQ8S922_PERAM|nr:hypothetical protein ANN_22674 [Periplaneta americana]